MTEYKGYTIEPETEPWALKYGDKYAIYCGVRDDGTKYAKTIEEAKEIIDELTEEDN